MKKMLSPTQLTEDQFNWVKATSKKEGESMATVVRNLINAEIQREKRRVKNAVAE